MSDIMADCTQADAMKGNGGLQPPDPWLVRVAQVHVKGLQSLTTSFQQHKPHGMGFLCSLSDSSRVGVNTVPHHVSVDSLDVLNKERLVQVNLAGYGGSGRSDPRNCHQEVPDGPK